MEDNFKQLAEKAKRIIVTSHASPDVDAVCSSLLLAETLKLNFPDKTVTHVLEERPAQKLDFLHGYGNIVFKPLVDALQELTPDLLIITDADDFDRISRSQAAEIKAYAQQNNVAVAIIDHHQADEHSLQANVVNRHAPAAAQEVYHLCFMALGWKKPEGYADTTLLGIVTDTVRFRYANPLHRETFEIVNDLLDAGADIQLLEDRLDRYTPEIVEVIGNLATNTRYEGEYSYSYIDDVFYEAYAKAQKPYAQLKGATGIYGDEFIRKIDDKRWGFIVYPDPSAPGTYRASFRAITGAKDVSKFAIALGGGGHIPAAAATIKAADASAAIRIVQDTIRSLDAQK